MDKKERLDLMAKEGVISVKAKSLAEEFISKVEGSYDLDWFQETANMFVTHLAVAINRMLKEEGIDSIPDELKAEKENSIEIYSDVEKIFAEVDAEKALSTTEAELVFIAVYINTLAK